LPAWFIDRTRRRWFRLRFLFFLGCFDLLYGLRWFLYGLRLAWRLLGFGLLLFSFLLTLSIFFVRNVAADERESTNLRNCRDRRE